MANKDNNIDENLHASSDANSTQNTPTSGSGGDTGQPKHTLSGGLFREKKWFEFASELDDSLLNCLVILCGLLHRPMSSASLKAGLPLDNNKMTPELFVRAASRAGLSARIVRKKLKDIDKLTLPCVLLLKGNKACLVTEIINENEVEVIFPETGRGSVRIGLEELYLIYDGMAIFAKPLYKYDERSHDMEIYQPRSWFWGTLAKFWPIYSHVFFAALLVNLFAVASPLFTMNVYDRVVPNNAIDTLWVLTIGILLMYFFDFLLKMLRVYFVDVAGKNADIVLASRIFEQVMNLKMSEKPVSSGSFANQLREFESLREFFSSATLVVLVDIPFVFLFLIIIYMLAGPLAFVPLISIPLILASSFLAQFPLQLWVRKSFREGAQKHALLIEAINGIETIKTTGAEGKMQKDWENFVDQAAGSSNHTRLISSLASNFSAFVQNLSYISAIVVGVYLISDGKLTMGALIACSILNARALAPLSQVVSLLVKLNQSMTALKALDDIIHLPVERPLGVTFLHRPHLRGNIEFKNVDFSYPRQEVKALSNVSFKIFAGEHVGIVGRIGSGKTTIERLLLGLYEPASGSILLDETDIRQIDPADVRTNIGYVPQDIYHFFGTVRTNIMFGNEDLDDNALMQAAQISGVMDFVTQHPKGFDMLVGEGGTALSGGQRQAIAVARALLKDPSIFVFDEPSAMMDQNSEARLMMRLKDYMKAKTLILITHRASLLALVDRVIVMDSGRIVADGPRDQVLNALTNTQIRTGAAQ